MLYKNTKVKVCSPDRDTDYIVEGMLQEDILAPYLFIICLDHVLQTSIDLMKEKAKKQKMPRTNYFWRGLSRWNSASDKYIRPGRISTI